jgi:hypothetical protein
MALALRSTLTPQQVHARARPGRNVIGWKVAPEDRGQLLLQFPPRYERTVADHVTLKARVAPSSPLPAETQGWIIGRSDDDAGVEALVVQIDGGTERPDGGTWHITWSLAEGRRAVESNCVIRARGWQPVTPRVPVRLKPGVF